MSKPKSRPDDPRINQNKKIWAIARQAIRRRLKRCTSKWENSLWRVLLALLESMKPELGNLSFITQVELGRTVGLSERQVRVYLKALVELGAIECKYTCTGCAIGGLKRAGYNLNLLPKYLRDKKGQDLIKNHNYYTIGMDELKWYNTGKTHDTTALWVGYRSAEPLPQEALDHIQELSHRPHPSRPFTKPAKRSRKPAEIVIPKPNIECTTVYYTDGTTASNTPPETMVTGSNTQCTTIYSTDGTTASTETTTQCTNEHRTDGNTPPEHNVQPITVRTERPKLSSLKTNVAEKQDASPATGYEGPKQEASPATVIKQKTVIRRAADGSPGSLDSDPYLANALTGYEGPESDTTPAIEHEESNEIRRAADGSPGSLDSDPYQNKLPGGDGLIQPSAISYPAPEATIRYAIQEFKNSTTQDSSQESIDYYLLVLWQEISQYNSYSLELLRELVDTLIPYKVRDFTKQIRDHLKLCFK